MITDTAVISGVTLSAGMYGLNGLFSFISSFLFLFCLPCADSAVLPGPAKTWRTSLVI